ncbi:MAG: alanine--tRNA ligase [Rhodospirillaceae bacterium]|nr:alanine--tRNA ligase [Rhodospirillaceae bacterium]
MPSTKDIRSTFLNFFEENGHTILPSSPLVPHNDPTLLFTNAGMVQFKNIFTGTEERITSRAATSQKCVRAGGKHNDLDNVGYTARHHTFFEMLGNFSFGDYFKEHAILLAWQLVNGIFELPADRLLVTIYHTDDEAFNLWRTISGLPAERIIRIDTNDNFWAMGDTGPCGPCSEIFYDHGDHIPGGPPGSPDQDGDRFVEIWNLVFMQFDQKSDGKRTNLPNPAIDTGMGLERIAAILQGVHDNYETDLFRSLINESKEKSSTQGLNSFSASHRIIADHLRAASFLIADGVMPSNEGRGYVLRRIMRRAMRHAHLMDVPEPLMWKLVPTLVQEMSEAFPELLRAQSLISETLKLEETRFRETLGKGMRLLEEATSKLRSDQELPGEVAFQLYDTYGFPLDLTEDVLRQQGRTVDRVEFDKAMDQQRALAKSNWSGSGDQATEQMWFDLKQAHGATEFLGYTTTSAEATVLAVISNQNIVEAAKAGAPAMVLVNQTPFYGESGGQVGDIGTISDQYGLHIDVTKTVRKADDLIIHIGTIKTGTLAPGNIIDLQVNSEKRNAARRNHSATHLLHTALRNHLGDHVSQKGSLVSPERLRFDLSHPKPITPDELQEIQLEINTEILRNSPIQTLLMTPAQAISGGALALFGEKYGAEVRVVTIGHEDEDHYSRELCGGTHVERTGDIGSLFIFNETAVGSGIRRIEAVTGLEAIELFQQKDALLRRTADALRVGTADIDERVHTLLDEKRKLEKNLAVARQAGLGSGSGRNSESKPKRIGDTDFLAQQIDGIPPKELRGLADQMKKRIGSGIIVLLSVTDGKVGLVIGVTEDLTGRYDAVEFVRKGAAILGGKGGGGRRDLAQAGGPNVDATGKTLEALEDLLKTL